MQCHFVAWKSKKINTKRNIYNLFSITNIYFYATIKNKEGRHQRSWHKREEEWDHGKTSTHPSRQKTPRNRTECIDYVNQKTLSQGDSQNPRTNNNLSCDGIVETYEIHNIENFLMRIELGVKIQESRQWREGCIQECCKR